MFGKKLVSDALLATVKEVTSGEQTDSSGNELLIGGGVTVQEGPHAGRTGMISGFHNTGRSEVQLNHGPSVAIYNEVLLNEAMSPAEITRRRKEQKREVVRGKRKSGKTSDKLYDYGIRKSEGKPVNVPKQQKTEEEYEELAFDHYLLDRLLAEAGFDAVDKKALKKKWKDREDQDIDNDGDEDESDRFLHKRRKAISKSKKGEKIEINPEIKEAIRKLIHSTLK
ncbi:MAG TPA: hypothetical protein EYG10_04190 [Gammaproteobacteria bacterium]|nr:hypothetical protein [Gammaproteobacteria bacterium]